MPEATIQLPPDSTGTKLRTLTNPGVAAGAHQEVVTLAGADGAIVVPLTDVQMRAAPVPVNGLVALDAPTLAALETITVANPTANPETGLATEASLGVLVGRIADETGTPRLMAGAAPATADVLAGERIMAIACSAGATAATVAIAGQATITVPANKQMDLAPKGAYVGVDVVIAGGVDSWVVEVLG